MPTLTLHHYAMSPFSEKVRSMLGYSGLPWQSVEVREFPPRPALDTLTGGYRKIPVAQIGADIFCDTRTISSEIARLADKPELALENCDTRVREFVARTDLEIFLACILCADGKQLLKQVRREHSLLHVMRLVWDRMNMGRKAKVRYASPKQAKGIVHAHAAELESMLKGDFLFGEQPNIGDFAAYHGLWFIRDLSGSAMLDIYPAVNAWMDRIKAFGHGTPEQITAEEAVQQARQAEPRALPESPGNDVAIGKRVTVGPTDYGRNSVSGDLKAATADRWIIEREHAHSGPVHVHFPRDGFALRTD